MSDEYPHLTRFDAVEANVIFCMWLGPAPMCPNRIRSLFSIFQNSGCPVVYITDQTVNSWQHPHHPFHPAFKYLSPVHKSDYLRCYLMHHYGGGYMDIKVCRRDWKGFFEQIRSQDKMAIGYAEIGPGAVAGQEGPLLDEMRQNFSHVIGMCAFAMSRRSPLTYEWYKAVHALLDQKLEQLKAHPPLHTRDHAKAVYAEGNRSQYPMDWAELLGCILHPLVYRYRQDILFDDMMPTRLEYER